MPFTLLSTTPSQIFEARSGIRYTSDTNGFYTNVPLSDVVDFIDAGMIVTGPSGNLVMAGSGLFYETAQVGMIAGTTRTQAGATAITKEVNRIDTSPTTGAANDVLGVMLNVGFNN